MSKLLQIQEALYKSFISTFTYPVEVDALPTPPNYNTSNVHVKLANVIVGTNPVTMGNEGEDETIGYFEIYLKYPKDKGYKEVLSATDQVAAFYKAGKVLSEDGVEVVCKNSGISPKIEIGNFIQYVLTVNYYSRNLRN